MWKSVSIHILKNTQANKPYGTEDRQVRKTLKSAKFVKSAIQTKTNTDTPYLPMEVRSLSATAHHSKKVPQDASEMLLLRCLFFTILHSAWMVRISGGILFQRYFLRLFDCVYGVSLLLYDTNAGYLPFRLRSLIVCSAKTATASVGNFVTGDMGIQPLAFFTSVTSLGSPTSGRCNILTSPNFGKAIPKIGFYYRILADAFTCFEFVLSQAPRQRTDTHFEARVPFFLSFPWFTTPTERIKGFVNAFEDRNLKVRHFTEIVIFLTGETVVLGHIAKQNDLLLQSSAF